MPELPFRILVILASTRETATPTLVQVRERFVVQFYRGRCCSAHHILKGRVFGFVIQWKAGIFLLENGQCQDITEKQKKK